MEGAAQYRAAKFVMLSDRTGPPPPDDPHAGGMIPEVVPPLPRENPRARNLPWRTALRLAARGLDATCGRTRCRACSTAPASSCVSAFVVWFLFKLELDYSCFPRSPGS